MGRDSQTANPGSQEQNRYMMKSGFHSVELNKTVWEVPERYINLSAIGSGAYGQVCSAEDTSLRTAEGKYVKVAIKKIARPFQSAVHAKRTYRELRMLKHMVHENIIGLLDCFTPQSTLDQFADVYMVTHLMGADLNNIIKTQKLSDDHVQFLIYQLTRIMLLVGKPNEELHEKMGSDEARNYIR